MTRKASIKLDNRTTIFLVSLVVATAFIFVEGSDERVDAWVAALIALASGGGGAALPQLLSVVRAHQQSAEQTTRSSDAGSDTEGPE